MPLTRRRFLASAAVVLNGCSSDGSVPTTISEKDPSQFDSEFVLDKSWDNACDQVWAGKEFWANRLADWHVQNGHLCTRGETTSLRKRTVSILNTAVKDATGTFSLSINTAPQSVVNDPAAFSGVLIGAGQHLDYRAAALIHNRHGKDGGLIIGLDNQGIPFIHDNDVANMRLVQGPRIDFIEQDLLDSGVLLQLDAINNDDGTYTLNVNVMNLEEAVLSSTSATVNAERLLGHMALIANPGSQAVGHWFNQIKASGTMLSSLPEQQFGPVLFSSFTVSRGTVFINVQLPPICLTQWQNLRLEAKTNGQTWQTLVAGTINPRSWTSRLKTETSLLDESQGEVRIAIDEQQGTEVVTHTFEMVIPYQESITDKSTIGLLSCRPSIILDHYEGWIQSYALRPFTWDNTRIGFPHAELLQNLDAQEPDLLAFVGDQLYEFDPNGIVVKSSVSSQIEDYLWKWYQFGWSMRELMRKTPAIIIPDDHDVFQGNIWGASGRPANSETDGGFVYSPDFVNVVQETQAGSLPDPFDSSAVEQGIGVYYTDIVYRGLGIAVLEDRKFKSGPNDPEPLSLLGARQETFLKTWSQDWQGQLLKLVVSQSPFAQASTHQSIDLNRVQFDPDANSWPKSGRDSAVDLLRRVRAPHLAGDQHLAVCLQHGIDDYQDAVFSMAGPSMLNVFPRIWDPRNEGPGPGNRGSDYKGNWLDGNNNRITIRGVMNPDIYYDPPGQDQYVAKEILGIGYALAKVDPETQTFQFEVWPANVNPLSENATPHPDWPITIRNVDNDGRTPSGIVTILNSPITYLLIEVRNESTGAIETAMRYTGTDISVPLYEAGVSYTLRVSDPEGSYEQILAGVVDGNQFSLL